MSFVGHGERLWKDFIRGITNFNFRTIDLTAENILPQIIYSSYSPRLPGDRKHTREVLQGGGRETRNSRTARVL